MRRFCLYFLVMACFATPAAAQMPELSVLGHYWSENNRGIIEIYRDGNEFKGRIVWRVEPKKDINNPEPALRDRQLVGIDFLRGFNWDGDAREWVDGRVYSPDNGKTYSGKMWLEDDGQSLKMRGYVGISWFGRTATFTRVQESEYPKGMLIVH